MLLFGILAVFVFSSPSVSEASASHATASEAAASDAAASKLKQQYSALFSDRISQSFRIQNQKIVRGPITFELKSGTLEFSEMVNGRHHAAIFSGEGYFHFVPPNKIEEHQLQKFSKVRVLNERFSWAVFRFTDGFADEFDQSPQASERQSNAEKFKEARKQIREKFFENIDSRILRDLVSDRQGYFLAYVSTQNKGALLFEVDPEEREEFSIRQHTRGFIDTWSSFSSRRDFISGVDIPYFELEVDIENNGDLRSTAILDIVSTGDPVRSIALNLSPLIEVLEVTDQSARSCFFVFEVMQDRAGEPALRQSKLDIFLDNPLPKGEAQKIQITYRSTDLLLRLKDRKEFVMHDTTGWYPTFGYLQRSKSKCKYRSPADLELLATGEKKEERRDGDWKYSTWEQNVPVTFICFTLGEFKHKRVSLKELPPADIFMGKSHGGIRLGADAIDNIGADIINSLNFFQQIYAPYPFSAIVATEIPGFHGQGFPGFLQLSQVTFEDSGFQGRDEAFRAHEVSHQWWGHLVGWETYHDQWISEGFAEFSGALFADATFKDQKKDLLLQIVEAWKSDVLHHGNLSLRNYGLPKMSSNLTLGSDSGPISLGYRLISSISPADYQVLVYEKGAYVLYMLRMMMRDFQTGSDEKFLAMMRDFVDTHKWKNATTESFRRIAEKHFGNDLGWFFNQWVYGTHIPRYRFRWSAESNNILVCNVEQSGVPDGFRMPVPVLIEFQGGKRAVTQILVDAPSKTFRLDVPEKPKRVTFNAFHSVLARD